MKSYKKWIVGIKLACLSSASVILHNCAPVPTYAPVAPVAEVSAMPSNARVAGAGQDALGGLKSATYKKTVTQNRPGIATGWGDEIQSDISYGSFTRASKSPRAISSIYYNDKEGIKAMTNSWNYSGKGMQKAAGGLVEWGVKSNWGYLKNVHSSGKRFVVGTKGRSYALVIKNIAHSKLEIVLSVDGLDVLDGKPASIKKRGYIIQPGKTLVVKGFRKSEAAVAAFEFSTVRDSYSNLSNQGTRNVGVIGMAVFTQKGVSPWRYGRAELGNRNGARAFAEAPSVRAR